MNMKPRSDLEEQTLVFSCELIDLLLTFPRGVVGDVIGRQLLRAGTSIGANYREANRAVSKPDFINKIGICEKEASETGYWLEICSRRRIGAAELLKALAQESRELPAIFVTIGKNANR
jgi:four helix bundle protein